MTDNRFIPSVAALRRKLRALGAIAGDPGATPPERANAKALQEQLEQRLRKAGAPAGDWTDHAFRLGRWAKQVQKPGSSALAEPDWPDQARRLGNAVGRGY